MRGKYEALLSLFGTDLYLWASEKFNSSVTVEQMTNTSKYNAFGVVCCVFVLWRGTDGWSLFIIETFPQTIPYARNWYISIAWRKISPATYLCPYRSTELSSLQISWNCFEECRATHVILFVVNHHVHVPHVTRVVPAHALLSFWPPFPGCTLEKGFSHRNAFVGLKNTSNNNVSIIWLHET